MHPTSCSRRLGYILSHQCSRHAFFNLRIQLILQCPPSWRALQLLNSLHLVDQRSTWVRWSGRILNGHVLRRVGLQSELIIYRERELSIYLMHIDSCMQDLAHAEMVSPSSSASEMEPVKDPNQRWLNSKESLFCSDWEDVSPMHLGTASKSFADKAHLAVQQSPVQVFLQ